jgi:Uma2 family endonuclease
MVTPLPEILTEPPLAPPSSLGPYRRPDYEQARQAEPRCELIRGRLYSDPAPSTLHQIVVQTLWRHFRAIAKETGGRAYFGPMDVAMAEHSVVRPDVFYLGPERGNLLMADAEGVPDLVVEVTSPGQTRRDRGEKLRLYADAHVAETWIAEPEESFIEMLVNEGGRLLVAQPEDGHYRSPAVPGVHLDVAAFWRQVARNLRHE